NSNNVWEVQCPHEQCDTWVKTSIKTHILLSIPGHFTNLEAQVGSKACGSMKTRKISQDTRAAVGALFPQHSQPLSVLSSARYVIIVTS
ncbi:hypothetical protein PAXRUDRAFT_136700, partial [Paxillus rubicundulus Ve08.2h10]